MLTDQSERDKLRDRAHTELHFTAPLTVAYWRGDVLEIRHEAHTVLVDDSGVPLVSTSSPALPSTARSALKPFQLWAGLGRGVGTTLDFSLEEDACVYL